MDGSRKPKIGLRAKGIDQIFRLYGGVPAEALGKSTAQVFEALFEGTFLWPAI
jgi:hypothetical protein